MRLLLNQLSATKTTEENQLLTTDSKEALYKGSSETPLLKWSGAQKPN